MPSKKSVEDRRRRSRRRKKKRAGRYCSNARQAVWREEGGRSDQEFPNEAGKEGYQPVARGTALTEREQGREHLSLLLRG
jgi:hypothetical protein